MGSEFIDGIDFDEEFMKLDDLDMKQLIAKKNAINSLRNNMLKNKHYKTTEQLYIFNEMQKLLFEDYPDSHTVGISDYQAEKNKIMRIEKIKEFNKVIKENNLIYVGKINYAKWMNRLDELIANNKTYNPKEYMNQEVFCECGSLSRRKNLSRHKESVRHHKLLAHLNLQKKE